MTVPWMVPSGTPVAFRKESVDRNDSALDGAIRDAVALRKESVDRNLPGMA